MDADAGETGVHPEAGNEEAARTGHTGDRRQVFASADTGRAGTGVGGAARPKSYGFRPGRGCHDAIGAIYSTLNGPNPQRVWILDADLTAAFDRIDHHRLLTSLGTFPARDRIEQWLTAGVVEDGRFTPTREGTPQGGVISPALFNVALHGMEQAAGVRYQVIGRDAGSAREQSPVLVRFADDCVPRTLNEAPV